MPVFNQIGAFIGVVALQMPVGRINDMMQVATGLGETGEAYIVGEDFLMRSDSRFSETSTILNRLVYTATSQKALAGESGIEVLEDARGGAVVSAYAPIEFMGARWAILAEISQAELLAPIAETGTFMIVAVAGILLLVTAVGIALARGLSRPIVEMTGNMRRLAAGDLDVEIGSTDRTDEIGEMAAALDVFKENAVRRQKAEASLKESGALFEQAGRMASLGHWAYDEIEERVTHCSEETARIHGLTVDEYKNSFSHGDTELMLVHPDDRQELGDIVENAYGDGKGYDTEYRIVRPDGAVRHVREVGEPVLDDSGTLVRTIGMVQDITERKETEDALRESQSLYLQAGRMAQFGHWIYDSAADRLVFCSEEVARMHGVSVDEIKSIIDSTEGSIGRVHPDDQEDYARAMRESEDRIEPYDLEIKIVRPDGAVRYLREMGEPVVDDNGSVVRYYGTIQDITERKNSEEELARKEAQLRIALDNMPGGILMIDEDNKIVVFNDQIRELFDLPEGVLVVGGPVETSVRYQAERGDFGEGDVDDLVEQVRAGFSSGEPTKYERRLFTGRVVEISVAPTPDGGEVAVYTDITERKRAEEELARKEAQLRVTLDNMPGGMFMIDENLVIQVYNEQYKEMYDFPDATVREGVSLAEAVRARAERGDYGPGDPEELVEQRMQGYVERMTLRHEEVLPNGRVIELLRTPVEGGGIVGITTDITERKAAEQKLTQTLGEFSAVLETIDYGIAFVDADLKARLFNRAVREMWDFSEEVLATMPAMADLMYLHRYKGIYDVADDEFDDYVATRVEAVRSGSIAPTEMTRADGKVFQFQCTALPDGGRMLTYFDITDRKRAEETLRASERRYATITANIPGVVYERVQHPDGSLEFPYVSDGLYETHGVKPEDAMRDANAWLDRTHPDDRESLAESNAESLAKLENWDHEYRIISGDGGTLWMHGSSHVYREENGDIVWHGILLDVTDRKRAEEALAEKETQLRVAMDNMPGGMLMVDKDKSVVVINEQYRELFDIPEDLMDVGGSVEAAVRYQAERGDFGEGDVDELFDRAMAISPSGEPIRYERRLFSGRVVEISLAPTPDGGEIAVYTDITERKRAEEALAEKEMQFRLAMDNMPGALVYTDEDLDIVVCSERFSEIMQAPRELLQPGQPYTEFLRYLAEHGYYGEGDIEALVAERVKSLRSPSGKTFEDLTPDGRVYHIRRQRVAAGGTVTVATDITERKRADEALAEKEAQLRVAMDNMPGGMRLVDRDLENVLFNARYGALCNYPNDLLEVGGSMSDELRYQAERGDFGPGDADARIEQVLDCYRLGEAASVERDIPGGPTLQIDIAPTPEGGFVSILTDITERKRAEEALREKSAIVELLHKTAADANQAQDIDEAMRGCLDAVCAYTGWPVGHAYVRSSETPDLLVPTDIWHLDEPKRFATFRKVTKKASFEAGVGLPGRVMESGKSAWIVDVTADPNFPRAKQAKNIGVKAGFAVPVMVGGRVEAVFEFFAAQAVEPDAALLDILDNIGGQVGRVIERKQAEAEVRRSEAILSSVLDQSPVAFTLKDTERKLLIVNEAHAEWFGENKEDLIGASSDATNPPDQVEMFAAADNEVLEHQQVIKPFEYRDEMPPRASLDLMVFKFPVQGAEGEVLGIGTIQMDITERKKAENELAEAHQLITSSIEYASRIQRSALPSDDMLSEALGEHCVIWQPRDVVGGDIYWMRRIEGGHIVAVADCTGHGVPGAFLTMIAIGALRQAIIEHPDGDPAKVIGRMNSFIKNSLRQDTAEGPSDDGLELGICRIDEAGEHLTFAGARFSLWQLNSQGAEEIKGDKSGIAYRHVPLDQAITNHEVPLTPGSAYYIFSDGLVDQVGGEKRRAFGKKRIIALLEEHLAGPLAEQRDAVMAAFTAYQGDEIRRDDVTFLGFRMHS